LYKILSYLFPDNIPAVSISVSSLSEIYDITLNPSGSINQSIFLQFTEQLNTLADIRDYLIMFVNNLTITNIESIILQATTVVQLTSTTNQLTRFTLVSKIRFFIVNESDCHI
jgi:hypothetical protein